tara:strand:+ start:34 stop:360 length:327 start_codon:yes stop_codon:yes gene_type:complete
MKLKPIKDKKKINTIFEKGLVINGQNISIRTYSFEGEEPGYVISVPKRNFPLAVKRNLLKRRMRSALAGVPISKGGVSFFLIYLSKQVVSSSEIVNELTRLLNKKAPN